ncbi:dihydrofolate reductase [Buchananella hordeovulneris]|uniref:Dihydrofolate reductase n=1 Tax=Buchananella hordeovulneris TaxID=52770 RepID=A0A1Q5PUX4_9ACTO|nr:dihydrofolate reductase family protein [Buchananella hordeovulneris]OKL51259.1 dihydrofolate reductase [Buchananella hordeovulneris]RRD52752.1 dihydrofolate reductase [Buchananella hordeovulneris]
MNDTRRWRGHVFIGVSLDGFIARPDGDLAWLTNPPGRREHLRAESAQPAESWETFFPKIDHIVMGRGTYDTVVGFDEWPDMYDDKTVIVLSTTLPCETSGVTIVRTLGEAVDLLDGCDAREVYVDGGQTIQSFLRAGLVDEITTCWAPILIGRGRRLFDTIERDVLLTLVGNHTTDLGMVHSTYRVERH